MYRPPDINGHSGFRASRTSAGNSGATYRASYPIDGDDLAPRTAADSLA